ncbi:MAG: hypothetical protein NW207_07640 [Cytophagales bacterium]|nr:hypothetical protein [Cytophagales bacterium]
MKTSHEIIIENLGKLTLNFSTLELTVSAFVSKLISDDSKIGAIITSEMSFQNLLKAFSSLSQYKLNNHIEYTKIFKLINRIKVVEQERNKLVHSAYAISNIEDRILRIKITAKQYKGLNIINEEINIKNFKNIITKIHEITHEIILLYKKIFDTQQINYA